MFNKQKVRDLENVIRELNNDKFLLSFQLDKLKAKIQKPYTMEDLMRESLGFPIDFSEADNDKCMPPHYLKGLESDQRKSFISDMEVIYSNDNFQKVVKYMINVFGMNALYKESDQDRKNGQIAIIAFRTFLKRFEEMHKEFLESKRDPEEDLDDQEILPR